RGAAHESIAQRGGQRAGTVQAGRAVRLVLVEGVVRGTTQQLARRVAEQARGRRVAEADAPVTVQPNDPVGRPGEKLRVLAGGLLWLSPWRVAREGIVDDREQHTAGFRRVVERAERQRDR